MIAPNLKIQPFSCILVSSGLKRNTLEEFGPRLPQPHAKHIGERLYELRLEGQEGQIRIFYFFDGKRVILAHAMKKKTQQLPAQEMDVAKQRQRAYFSRV